MTSQGNHRDEHNTHTEPYPLLGMDISMFSKAGFDMDHVSLKRNAPVAQLYEEAVRKEGAVIASSGALTVSYTHLTLPTICSV